jgi:hypothetical protein
MNAMRQIFGGSEPVVDLTRDKVAAARAMLAPRPLPATLVAAQREEAAAAQIAGAVAQEFRQIIGAEHGKGGTPTAEWRELSDRTEESRRAAARAKEARRSLSASYAFTFHSEVVPGLAAAETVLLELVDLAEEVATALTTLESAAARAGVEPTGLISRAASVHASVRSLRAVVAAWR